MYSSSVESTFTFSRMICITASKTEPEKEIILIALEFSSTHLIISFDVSLSPTSQLQRNVERNAKIPIPMTHKNAIIILVFF